MRAVLHSEPADNMAVVDNMAILDTSHMPPSLPSYKHGSHAERYVADFFRSNNWNVELLPNGPYSADLSIERGNQRFIVEIKALSESRPDRVLPMLSMAILQARAAAEHSGNALPLAVVFVPEASLSLANRVDRCAQRFAKDVPVGVISGRGEQYFSGEAFQQLNRLPEEESRSTVSRPPQPVNLFSDLNQWMLKLLLAWELTLSQALRQALTTVGNFWPQGPTSNTSSSPWAAWALTAV